MKMKNATLLLVVSIFILNFILIGGYFKYFLIPQLSNAIENNNEQLHQDMIDVITTAKRSRSILATMDSFSKERNLSILVENTRGEVLYNNNPDIWVKGTAFHVTTFFQVEEDIYLIKIYRRTDAEDIPALNNFIIFEIIVILVIVLIIFETTNQRIISPIEKLQKSIKNYKFGIKPSKTTGHTEIDIIQNNFVDLVDALESEKQKQNRIIASISHDIKTPLTAIMGYSDRLLHAKLDKSKKYDYIDKIHAKAITLRDLTEEFDDYLSCNMKESLKCEEIHISELMKIVKEDYNEDLEEKSIKLLIETTIGDEIVNVDLPKMKRVFSNIIANSVRFTEKKGKITLKCKKIDKYIEFIISDTGKGVPEKDLNKIFEPLFTSDPSRRISGLGLSICKEIVEIHGGYIYARNNQEKGLDVIFTIKNN
jgi:Signal transduction histidine kinase